MTKRKPSFWPTRLLAQEWQIIGIDRRLKFSCLAFFGAITTTFGIFRNGTHLAIVMDIKSSDELLKFLEEKHIASKTFEHPPVYTVEESRKLRGDIPGAHTKNLFLRDAKKNYFLLVADEKASVDIKALARKIGAKGRLSFGSPEALLELLGITPGSVSVLAAINDKDRKVTIVLDEQLLQASAISCHPLINQRTTVLSTQAIGEFLAATGHEPIYVALDEDTPEP
jgi:Ala-tRNA(Pro) deacylase